MAVFEAEYKSEMTQDEAMALAYLIMTGINNDLGSGGSVDLHVIGEGRRPGRSPATTRGRMSARPSGRVLPRGTAKILEESCAVARARRMKPAESGRRE